MLALILSLAALCVSPTSGFVPLAHSRWSRPTSLLKSMPDEESRAYSDAERATAKFGAGSKEAKLAWDAVSDFDEYHDLVEMSQPALDDECDIEKDIEKCIEFDRQMSLLQELKQSTKAIESQLEMDIQNLEQMKLNAPAVEVGTIDEAGYQKACAEAESASQKFGADSREARAAWSIVAEIEDSAEYSATDAPVLKSLDEECLVSNSQKCVDYQMALDALQQAIVTSENNDFNKSV